MLGNMLKHWQISLSILFSVVLVTGSYLFTQNVIAPRVAEASAETELLQALATKDSDADGLPNWQESLYGTDANVADTFKLGMTDGAAVAQGLIVPKAITDVRTPASSSGASSVDGLPPAPEEGTLTAQFAETFFTNFLAAREANGGADLSESQMNDVANQTVAALTSSIKPAPDFKSMKDLNVTGSGPEAMRTFAVSAEAVLRNNKSDATTTDIAYLKSAIIDGNESAYGHIASIAKGFRSSAAGIAVLPVPEELASDALLLINTLMRMGELDTDFTQAESDPLVAILALQQYQTVTTALGKAFLNIGKDYAAAYISLPSGAPGAMFVNMIADIEREQPKTKTP